MKRSKIAACLAAMIILATPASAQMTREEAMKLARQYRGQMGTLQTEIPDPIALTEADLTGFINVVTQLRGLGLETRLAGERTDPAQLMRGLALNEQAQGIFKSNGFPPERFQSVMFSIALALATVEGDLDPARLDEAHAAQAKAMEQMKGRLTQEQIDAVGAGLGAAGSYMERLRNQPPGNPELIRARLAELKRALGDEGR